MTLQDCSKSDETFSSIPDSAIAGVESKEESTISLVKPNRSDATIFSNKDSAVDVNSPAAGKVLVSSPDFVMGLEEVVGDALRTADLNAAQAKARNVYSNSSLPPPITSPEAGLSLKAAKAATGSVFIENFSPPSTRSLSPSLHHSSTVARPSRSNSPRIHLLNTSGTLSRVNSLSNPSAVSAWPPFQNLFQNSSVRRVGSNTNLRPSINGRVTTKERVSIQERIIFVDMWDEQLGRRVIVPDRPPTVRHFLEQWEPQAAPITETIQDGNPSPIRSPIPAALVADRHNYIPGRHAPLPPDEEERKSWNPLKRFCQRLARLDERWDARKERKCAVKAERRARKSEAKHRRRESMVRAKNTKFAIKQEVAAHRKRQVKLKATAKATALRQKEETKERARTKKIAIKEQKRKDAEDAREEKLRKARDRAALKAGRERDNVATRKKYCVHEHVINTMRRYGGYDCHLTSPDKQRVTLLREEVLGKRCKAAQAKCEREEAERIEQKIDNLNARKQAMTWWEMLGLSNPTREESSEDSESLYSQDTREIEDAVRRVGERVDDARMNVL